MNMRLRSGVLIHTLLVSMCMTGVSLQVLAADEPPAAASKPSTETRERMAVLHEKMAACLRSDKEFSVCRDEMLKNCQQAMGDQGCPMMGMGREHWRMYEEPQPKPKSD